MKKTVCFFLFLILFGYNAFSDDLIPFSYNGKYGYINNEFIVVIKPIFKKASHFSADGFAIVFYDIDELNPVKTWRTLRNSIINNRGQVILSAYSGMQHIYGDLYSLQTLSTEEHVIIRLRDNKIIARDATGYAASGDGYFMAAFIKDEKRFYFLDSDGNKVLTHLNMKRTSASFFEQRARIVNEDWSPEIIDMEGKIVGNIKFNRLGHRYSEGLIPAKTEGGVTGYVNKSGSFAFTIPFLSDEIPIARNFSGGYAAIKTNLNPSIWKIINTQGRIVSENILVSDMWDFSDGLSLVSIFDPNKNETKYGYVNTKGEYLVRPILESADHFKNGYARIVYNGQEGLFKTNGRVIWSTDIMRGSPVEKDLR